MMRTPFILSTLIALGTAFPVLAQDELAASAPAGVVRVLDKLTGNHEDLTLQVGETGEFGYLHVTLNDCRYPTENPSGDAFISLHIQYRDEIAPVFTGWMVASSPGLNALDHQRYDVWALRCITS